MVHEIHRGRLLCVGDPLRFVLNVVLFDLCHFLFSLAPFVLLCMFIKLFHMSQSSHVQMLNINLRKSFKDTLMDVDFKNVCHILQNG